MREIEGELLDFTCGGSTAAAVYNTGLSAIAFAPTLRLRAATDPATLIIHDFPQPAD
jgi:hypothetical protein